MDNTKYEFLIANCEKEFNSQYPNLNSVQMVSNMGMIMLVFEMYKAPINTKEFIEALRYTANILEILVDENKKVN